MANITADKLVVNTSLSAREIQTSDFKVKQQDGSLMSISEQLKKIPENWVKTVNGISADEEGNVKVQVGGSDSFIYTDPSTGDKFEVFGRKIPHPDDGSEQYPWSISTVQDLLNLKAAVDGTASEDNPYGASDHYKLANDIDMNGVEWNGIGLQSASSKNDPDPDHTFKGTFDGDNHVIKNLTFHCVGGEASKSGDGKANRYLALFRTAGYGATIKNLTVNVDGVDKWYTEDIMAAAIVGLAAEELTIENCTANGTLGTSTEPLDNSAGILCRVAVTPEWAPAPTITFTNVTNNVDVYSICKAGGFISYAYGTLNFNNVSNNGKIARVAGNEPPADHNTRDDAVGGLVGYGHQDGSHVTYNFNGVENNNIVETDNTYTPQLVGQLVGKWSVMNATNTGDVVVLNSNDVPAAKACPTTGSDQLVGALPIYLGKLGADGYLHGVSTLENGSEYVYMASNISESSGNVVTGPAYTLPNGATITVEHRFGTPKITNSNNVKITGTLVSGNVYRYTA